jgi:hypothetical protein
MFIPDRNFINPGSRFLSIPDPTKGQGVKSLFSYLFCSYKYHKIENYFIFEQVLFTPKMATKFSKIWVWDQGSEIRDPKKVKVSTECCKAF